MKAAVFVAALAACANGAVIEGRQRPTSRPVANPGEIPDGIASPITKRTPQNVPPPQFSIGRPTQSVTFFPNDPPSDLPDLSECGLDAFIGHTSEALLFCSSLLKSGTATKTATVTTSSTTTTKTTVITTLYPPTAPTSTPRPPTSTPKPPSSTPKPPSSTPQPPSSTPKPPSSTSKTPSSSSKPPSSTPRPPSSSSRPSSTPQPPSTTPGTPTTPSSSPSPTPTGISCGIVGYTKDKAAYYFDSSGTKNTWQACGSACKADTKCKSFGYGEANCLHFDVTAAENTNYNPMSPYTFYDQACPEELPVKKRQINITIGLPGGPPALSSACSCLITSGPADVTRTTTTTTGVKVTRTETVTRTVSLLPDAP